MVDASNKAGSTPRVSAVVPVYNEVESTLGAVEALREAFAPLGALWEIVFVESGSTDGTRELCDRLAAEVANIRVIHQDARYGFGSAIRAGIDAALGEFVAIVPVDLPFPLKLITESLTQNWDVVVSYRETDPRPLLRRIQSVIFNALARRLLDIEVRSINSAFKMYRRTLLMDLPLKQNGWLIDAEILHYLSQKGTQIREVPSPLLDRQAGISKVGTLDGLKVFRELLALRINAEPVATEKHGARKM